MRDSNRDLAIGDPSVTTTLMLHLHLLFHLKVMIFDTFQEMKDYYRENMYSYMSVKLRREGMNGIAEWARQKSTPRREGRDGAAPGSVRETMPSGSNFLKKIPV